MKLLILHGDIKITAQWQVAFGAAGHEVRRARCAEDAQMLLRDMPFDVLLFDLVVAGESGLSAAFLAQFHQPHIAAILVSDCDPELQNDLFARLSCLARILSAETPVADLMAICEATSVPAYASLACEGDWRAHR